MSLSPGTRLGPYQILSPIGAGGMGEVYRAKDTRLGRDVAVKVLPSHLSDNPELKQRFEREAKAISLLTHPHICTLYDVGHQDGVDFLVMELLEGQSLADRLEKGPLPTDQVLKLGIEIADALDRAHRAGIVHRDLKPGNVMLTKSGVKLLDFGLAKMAAESPASDQSSLPTQAAPSQPLTEKGTVMGTFQYMAPEQLEGKEADARSDIFSFGCVLYEMATGKRAFSGASHASLISSILTRDPEPISAAAPTSPPVLDRVVRTCLAKDPDGRWQSAADVGALLRWIGEDASAGISSAAGNRARGREALAWAVAALLAIAAGGSFLLHRQTATSVVRAEIVPPAHASFALDYGPMVLSPDGKNLAFVAAGEDGGRALWVRPVSATTPRRLPGTEDPTYPFWSPDGRSLAFFSGGKLKRADLEGGAPQTICDAVSGRGGTWNREGVIVFAPAGRGTLLKVSEAGGAPGPAGPPAVNEEFTHRFPFFLPDGRHFLYESWRRGPDGTISEMAVGSLDSKETRTIARVFSNSIYAPRAAGASDGWLLYARDATLVAQRFDANHLAVTGAPVTVGSSVAYFSNSGHAAFTASNTGMLAYQPGNGVGEALSQPTWFDRGGKVLGVVGAAADYRELQISHDGRRAAVDIYDRQSNQGDIWTIDLERGVASRLTFGPRGSFSPVWSPDDRRVAFESRRGGPAALFAKPSSGSGAEETLGADDGLSHAATDWSPDGKFVIESVLGNEASSNNWDVIAYSLEDRKRVPLVATSANEYDGALSPDGRFLAYVSEESGIPQIYVQPFRQAGGKWQISSAGGRSPVWGRGGKGLYYIAPDSKLMEVTISAKPSFEAGPPRALFTTHIKSEGGRWPGRRYDVTADGRFLVNTVVGENTALPITLVENWPADLGK